MKAKNCNNFKSRMPDALSGGLDDVGRRAFEAHLEACEACKREFSELKEIFDFLDVPDTRRENVAPIRSSSKRGRRMIRGYWMQAASFILIAISAITIYSIMRMSNTTGDGMSLKRTANVATSTIGAGNESVATPGKQTSSPAKVAVNDDPYDGANSSMLGMCYTNQIR